MSIKKLIPVIIVLLLIGAAVIIYDIKTNPMRKLQTNDIESVEISVRRYNLDNYEFSITVEEGIDLLEILKDTSGKYKGEWIDLGMMNLEVVVFNYENGDYLAIHPNPSCLGLIYDDEYYYIDNSNEYTAAVNELVENYSTN